MRAIFQDLQTSAHYGALLPAPGVWQGTTLVSTGSYTAPQVFSAGGTWYMRANFIQVSDQTSTVLFSAPSPLGPWSLLGETLSLGASTSWNSSAAMGYLGLAGAWGQNGLHTFQGKYFFPFVGNNTGGEFGPDSSIGMAWATDPTQAQPWSQNSAPVLNPFDLVARFWEQGSLFAPTVMAPALPVGGFPLLMFAGASNGATNSIGLFGSTDMLTWQRYGADPIVGADTQNLNDGANNPQVFLHSSGLYVLNYALTENASSLDTFAATDDPALLSWTRYKDVAPTNYTLVGAAPVTNRGGTANLVYDNQSAAKPWLLRDRGITYHFYDSYAANNYASAPAVAVSSLAANSSFEEPSADATPTYWSAYCGTAGTDCDASYVDAADAHAGSWELTQCKEADYDVTTYQPITDIVNGTYAVSAWVRSSGGQYSAAMTVTGYGGLSQTVPIGLTPTWTQIVVPVLSVTTGELTVGFSSHGRAGSFLHVDDLAVVPLGRNFSFDIANYPSQDVAGWTSSCFNGSANGPCAADYVEDSGRTGYRLTHAARTSYAVYTGQTVQLPNGVYTASAWALSPSDCSSGGSASSVAYMEIKDYGGLPLQQNVPVGNSWQQMVIANIQVTDGALTLGFYSDCAGGSSRSFDDVQLESF